MNYSKNIQLKWLFSTLFVILSSSLSFAQIGDDSDDVPCPRQHIIRICQTGNWSGDTQPPSNCENSSIWGTNQGSISNEVEILISAYAVNIPGVFKGDDDTSTGQISFPEGYPDPYLRYEYSPGVFKHTDILDDWVFEEVVMGSNCEPYNLYSASRIVTIMKPHNATCEDETSTINFDIEMGLATYVDVIDDFLDYPLDVYGGSNDIFSCQIFNDTKPLCYIVDSEFDPSPEVGICIPCHIFTGDPIKRNASTNIKQDLKILSNPFSESLEYNFETTRESLLKVGLYTMKGQLVISKSVKVFKGSNRNIISTESIGSGIYYLSIHSEGKSFVKKVVCTK